ncbi:MAG: GIY-YIG nuclease family protein [Candidatus Pacebacteria bacterium]|nr:GIY-YIG nuclease family protein [Candidatus Paceibacterota bacterium]
MFYVYLLHSAKDGGLYIGLTENLQRRIEEHKRGSVTSTRNRLPIKLIHYESFLRKQDAEAREKYLKSGYGRQQLKDSLKTLFKQLNIN